MTTYEELYEAYFNALEVQCNVIKTYRLKLSEALKNRKIAEAKRLRSILCILYDEKNELQELLSSLEKYRCDYE